MPWEQNAGNSDKTKKAENKGVIMEEEKCFCSSLFDLSFNEFITQKVIKIIYMIGIAIAAIAAIVLIIRAFYGSFATGLVHVIAAPVVFVLIVIALRIYLELVLTLFRIEENTRKPEQSKEIPETTPQQ